MKLTLTSVQHVPHDTARGSLAIKIDEAVKELKSQNNGKCGYIDIKYSCNVIMSEFVEKALIVYSPDIPPDQQILNRILRILSVIAGLILALVIIGIFK